MSYLLNSCGSYRWPVGKGVLFMLRTSLHCQSLQAWDAEGFNCFWEPDCVSTSGWESGTGVEVVERRRGSVRATWSAGDGVTGRGSKTGDAEVGDAGLEVAGIELKIGNKEGGVVGLEFHF
ncbi:hypothetical protein WJX79_004456 [Trebouxia sp. C0005]